jgi:hypothetical protein
MGIDADDGGYVSVIVSSHNPPSVTYLIQMHDNFLLKVIQFDDIDWAKDWFTTWQHWVVWAKEVVYVSNFLEGKPSQVDLVDIDWLGRLVLPGDHPLCPEIKERR